MKFILPLIALVTLPACSTMAHVSTVDSGQRSVAAATTPGDVKVYSIHDIGKSYVVLGPVIVGKDAGTNSSGVVDDLRAEAAALGANAIVDLRLGFTMGFWNTGIVASGVAVKY